LSLFVFIDHLIASGVYSSPAVYQSQTQFYIFWNLDLYHKDLDLD